MINIRIKNWIILGLVSILIVSNVILFMKLSKQQQLNVELQNTSVIDSIKIENKSLLSEIKTLEDELKIKRCTIDSLQKIKQRIIVKKEYVVSDKITESVVKLQENLKWERSR